MRTSTVTGSGGVTCTRVVDKLKSKGKLTRYKLEFSQADDMDENSLFIRKVRDI